MVFFRVLVAVALVGLVSSKQLPSYIKRCKKSDTALEECAVKNANDALPAILKGDPHYGIPNLVPLEIPHIFLSPEENLNINMSNCQLFGLENTIITAITFDFDRMHCAITAKIDHLNLISDYDINGKILVLPIVGSGPANITIAGGVYKYQFYYDLKRRHGNNYLHFANHTLDYTTERIYIKLENLFNGDKTLGEPISAFLHDSWREVSDELYPSLKQTIGSIISTIASGFLTKVPYEDLFDHGQ